MKYHPYLFQFIYILNMEDIMGSDTQLYYFLTNIRAC